jgi:hypothetical protein
VLSWTRERKIANTDELVQNVRLRGGSIIAFDRIESVLIACERSHRYEWVGPGEDRKRAGLKHALYCLLLGPWSLPGLVGAPVAVVANLMGGVDVTESFIEPDGVMVKAGVMEAEEKRHDRMRWIVSALAIAAIIGLTIHLAVTDERRP